MTDPSEAMMEMLCVWMTLMSLWSWPVLYDLRTSVSGGFVETSVDNKHIFNLLEVLESVETLNSLWKEKLTYAHIHPDSAEFLQPAGDDYEWDQFVIMVKSFPPL